MAAEERECTCRSKQPSSVRRLGTLFSAGGDAFGLPADRLRDKLPELLQQAAFGGAWALEGHITASSPRVPPSVCSRWVAWAQEAAAGWWLRLCYNSRRRL